MRTVVVVGGGEETRQTPPGEQIYAQQLHRGDQPDRRLVQRLQDSLLGAEPQAHVGEGDVGDDTPPKPSSPRPPRAMRLLSS